MWGAFTLILMRNYICERQDLGGRVNVRFRPSKQKSNCGIRWAEALHRGNGHRGSDRAAAPKPPTTDTDTDTNGHGTKAPGTLVVDVSVLLQ